MGGRNSLYCFSAFFIAFIKPDQHLLVRLSPIKRHTQEQFCFVGQNGRVGFPFLLRRATLPVVERQLRARRFSLQQLARALRAQTLRLPRARARESFNINTPADLKVARDRWRRAQKR